MKAKHRPVNIVSYPNPFSSEKENVIIYGYKNCAGTDLELFDQMESLKTFCADNNLNIVMEVAEKGIKTHSSHIRPLQSAVFSFCEMHKGRTERVDKILFVEWDRISRNLEKLLSIVETFKELGVKMSSIDKSLRFDHQNINLVNNVSI